MKYEMIKCSRCRGTGITGNARVHLGIPGLCFMCDGTGEVIKDRFIREMGKEGKFVGITTLQGMKYDEKTNSSVPTEMLKEIKRVSEEEEEESLNDRKVDYKVITEEQARKFFSKYRKAVCFLI